MSSSFGAGKPVQYGLIKRGPGAPGSSSSSSAPPQRKLRPSVFDALEQDDDDDSNTNNNEDRNAAVKRMNHELQKRSIQAGSALVDLQVQAALESDPSVFDYDGHYDIMQKERDRVANAKAKQLEASVKSGEAAVSD